MVVRWLALTPIFLTLSLAEVLVLKVIESDKFASGPQPHTCCLCGVKQSDNGTLVNGLILYSRDRITGVSFGYDSAKFAQLHDMPFE